MYPLIKYIHENAHTNIAYTFTQAAKVNIKITIFDLVFIHSILSANKIKRRSVYCRYKNNVFLINYKRLHKRTVPVPISATRPPPFSPHLHLLPGVFGVVKQRHGVRPLKVDVLLQFV